MTHHSHALARNHAVIEPDRIARLFERNGMTPVTSANQLPDADVSSSDPLVRQRGVDRHRVSLRLARDMGAKHMGGVLNGLLGKAVGPAPTGSLDVAADCLALIADEAKAMGVRLAIEIVNRYESNLINTVADALAKAARRCSQAGAPRIPDDRPPARSRRTTGRYCRPVGAQISK